MGCYTCKKETTTKYKYDMWIDHLFLETMRYVPFSRVSKAIWIYRCLDCGKSTSAGLHCTSK